MDFAHWHRSILVIKPGIEGVETQHFQPQDLVQLELKLGTNPKTVVSKRVLIFLKSLYVSLYPFIKLVQPWCLQF